ncbi:MAG TPA: dihydrofolate reductase family protein [Chloroflexota bacterium]|nr:dihydrofolate reductase family protein [Chloroflexota bacterium]
MVLVHPRPLLGESPIGGRPFLAVNMVATVDGRAALNGSAVGIGSALDHRLLFELRAEADVVLHGAGTVRADPLSARVPHDLVDQRLARGQTPQPLGAIITRSGNLPRQHPYYDSLAVIYVTTDSTVPVDAPLVEIRRVASVEAAVHDLGQRGVRRILCEGGPTLNAALFEAGLVDDVFLTIAPKLVGGLDPLTIVKGGAFGTLPLTLRSLAEISGELFLHYAVGRYVSP